MGQPIYREHIFRDYNSPLRKCHRDLLCTRPRKHKEGAIRFLLPSERQLFLAELAKRDDLFLDLALVQLETGLRAQEVAALTIPQVLWTENQIVVNQRIIWERKAGGKTFLESGTKSGPSRTVFMTKVCQIVFRRRREEALRFGKVFHENGKWLEYRKIQSVYDLAFRKAGLAHRGTHVARHTFAVSYLNESRDPRALFTLQALLGHSKLETTQMYAKVLSPTMQAAFEAFEENREPGKLLAFANGGYNWLQEETLASLTV